jgi:hypothetical protein
MHKLEDVNSLSFSNKIKLIKSRSDLIWLIQLNFQLQKKKKKEENMNLVCKSFDMSSSHQDGRRRKSTTSNNQKISGN